MAENSGIQWTDHTFNPWIGCQKISEACKHCYAEVSTPARTLRAGGLETWGPAATTERKKTSAANWKLPGRWNRAAERSGVPAYVFASSLCDVFEDHPEVGPWRRELFALIERTPHLVWQLLTKRPENLRRMLPATWLERPRENVWFGTTVENQRAADERVRALFAVPAEVRFLSCEPLVEAVDLGILVSGIDWVIVGGESGPSARPFDLAWARAIVEQCREAGTAVFVKQLGARPAGDWGKGQLPVLNDRLGHRGEWVLRDSHGGDPAEWPEDLRVREMPRRAR